MEINAEDKLLCRRVEDFIRMAQQSYICKSTFFLDERQQALCIKTAQQNHFNNYSLFGGHDSSQRRVFATFSEFMQKEDIDYEITPLTCTYADFRKLTHRDFLGSLMNLGIKRECIGDILVGEKYTVIFVVNSVVRHITENLTKVASVGIKVQQGIIGELPQAFTLMPLSGTVSSLRLDCIVSMLTGLSREKSSQLITSGAVFINYIQESNGAKTLNEKDMITIRSYGKFIFESINGTTKKGRISVLLNKFV